MKHSKIVTNTNATLLSSHSARTKRRCGRALPALAMIATLAVAGQSAQAQQIFADWDAGTGSCGVGVWTDDCWGCEPMPNNGFIGTTCGGGMGDTYVAGISDGNANVTMNIDITLDGLVIFGGVQLNTMIIPNSRILTIEGGNRGKVPTGFIDINDLLVLQATNNFTELKVVAGPSGSTLIIDSPVSPGEIRMSNNTGNRIYGATGTETIIFGADLTVRGSGDIGANLTTLINQGTIVADQSILLQIDPSPGGGMTNSGLMVARDGGLLLLRPGVYDNALGEIRAEDGSTVRFDSGAQITGGLMVAQSGGLFEFNGGTLLGPTVRIDVGGLGEFPFLTTSTIENLTNHGVINQINAATLHTAGQFNNTGTYFMNSINNLTDLILDSDTVLDGGGVINMSQNGGNRIYGATGTETFTNVDNTIRGSGDIGANLTTIINQGTIVADQSVELRIDPRTAGGGMTNSGTLRAENGAELQLYTGPFTTSGSVVATTGSTITRVATDYIQTAGSTIIDGVLTLNAGGTVTLDGGILGGSGQVNAHVNNVAGTASPGSSPGTLTVNGNYTQGIDASFAVEISGTRPGQFDVLAINGNATLAGTLEITFIDAFDPLVGQMFTVLTANNVSGEFDNIDSCAGISVAYNETSVVLTITSACVFCPWDLDDSGSVGTNDLLALFAQWGTAGSADFDESGAVGTSDLLILFANWGPCP